MSTISLGFLNTQNGRTTSSGLASGLDSKALIDGILQGRTLANEKRTDTVTANSAKISALGDLNLLLQRFRTTVDFLRSPPGIDNENNDFFKHTLASSVSNTAISASTYVSVTSVAGAAKGIYDIQNIVTANEQILQKTGFTDTTTSVVSDLSVTNDYTANFTYSSGTELNITTPLTVSNDTQGTRASIDLVFGTQNVFDAGDSITFNGGSTVVTFGGGGGDDLDISGASTVSAKLQVVADYMNSLTASPEQLYTYSVSGNTLTVTRDAIGNNTEVGTNMAITADFSSGTATQTIAIGSEAASNNPTGGALNSLGTEGGYVGAAAKMEVLFGEENKFDALDSITFGSTTITFGGGGGADLDISSATTLSSRVSAIADYMNSVATGDESDYTYTATSTNGIDKLTITRDVVGDNATVGTNLAIASNFSNGNDTTQKIKLGSANAANGSATATLNVNGTEGHNAATKATIKVLFSADNEFDLTSDSITFGATVITFDNPGTGDVGNVLDINGEATLAARLQHIADHMNSITTGDEANYDYSVESGTTIVATREVYGSDDIDMTVSSDFSIGGGTAQDITIGSGGTLPVGPDNGPQSGTVVTNGTNGVDITNLSNADTTHTSTLSGAITMNTPIFVSGSGDANSFSPNYIQFKATVGGETYTSKPVYLDAGSVTGGTGLGSSGFGNTIAAGTVITFVKDEQTDLTSTTKDVTFSLTVGDAKTIANQAAATTYATTDIQGFLTTNSVSFSQTSAGQKPFRAGTFELGGVDITLVDGDNLSVIAKKINAVSSSSGVSAQIVKVSESSYNLVLKAVNPGIINKIKEYGDGDVNDIGTGQIKIGGGNVAFTEQQAANDATFDLDGVTITRSTNQFSDVIDKVTFSLLGDTPDSDTVITTSIASDTSIVESGITDFLNAYNDLKFFISAQTERDANNELVETAILGRESVLRDVLQEVDQQITASVSGLVQGNLNTLFEAGVDFIDFPGDDTTPATNNIFVLDSAKLQSALAADFDEVRKVFSFDFTANSADISLFKRSNKSTLSNFKLVIDSTATAGQEAQVQDSNGTFLFYATYSAANKTITGIAGTSLEGSVFVYTGDGSDTIDITMTQGIADKLYNSIDSMLTEDTGVVDITVSGIQSLNDAIQDQIDKENTRIESERERLIERFTRLETIISGFNSVLSFFAAQRAELNNSN